MLTRSTTILAATALFTIAGIGQAFAHHDDDSDCRDDNRTTGTVLGAIAGGLIGSAASHGNGGAVVGGVIVGGLAGNAIAGDMNCDDRPYAYRTYRESFEGDVGERYEWHHDGDHGYIVTNREYWHDGRVCRDFTVVTWRDEDEYHHDGTACRDEDGEWRFM